MYDVVVVHADVFDDIGNTHNIHPSVGYLAEASFAQHHEEVEVLDAHLGLAGTGGVGRWAGGTCAGGADWELRATPGPRPGPWGFLRLLESRSVRGNIGYRPGRTYWSDADIRTRVTLRSNLKVNCLYFPRLDLWCVR